MKNYIREVRRGQRIRMAIFELLLSTATCTTDRFGSYNRNKTAQTERSIGLPFSDIDDEGLEHKGGSPRTRASDRQGRAGSIHIFTRMRHGGHLTPKGLVI